LFLTSCNKKEEIKPFAGASGKFVQLVWHDEFNGSKLPDSTKWNYEKGYVRNQELQYYTCGRVENVYQENGFLNIIALNDSAWVDGSTRPITSASITTQGKGFWKYGRVEVRAKIASSLGSWPAIWMMPENSVYGGWPQSGEIDIMEHVGYAPDSIFFNVYAQEVRNNRLMQKVYSENTASKFHVFALEWTENEMIWYLDENVVHTVTNERSGWEIWPFDEEFYLIINLAFGGVWGGMNGIDMASFPLKYMIDYVRVFQ
jgi:beta-glucanase (GH16 family)